MEREYWYRQWKQWASFLATLSSTFLFIAATKPGIDDAQQMK